MVFFFAIGTPYTSTYPRLFNPESWRLAEGDARCGMIADLEYRIGIVGQTRADLYRMLGKPEVESGGDPNLSQWGLCPSFMDYYILEVRWRNNVVVSAEIRDT